MASLKAIADRIDELSLKERVLLLASLVLVLSYAWQALVLDPLNNQRLGLSAEIENNLQRIADLEAQTADLVSVAEQDPDAAARQGLAEVEQRSTALRAAFTTRTGQLIEPRRMAEVLKSVLAQFSGLSFVSVESLGAEPLLRPDGDRAEVPDAGAFRHGMRLRFEGSYLDTLAYLHQLEAAPYGFFWESVEFEVDDYPHGRGSVVVFTLSTTADWIGA